MSALSSSSLRNARPAAHRSGRHAAPRPSGPLAQVVDSVPTVQEVLLWEQSRRYRSLDALESQWHRWGRNVAIVAFIAVAVAVGAAIGAAMPVLGG